MKKYIDYEELRQILKERQIVRDTPDRRDEIGEIIFLIDNMAETNAGEELADALYDFWEEIRLDINKCLKKLSKRSSFMTETKSTGWIPVTPETMPPESHGTSDALLLRGVSDGYAKVYAGFASSGEWYTYADWHREKMSSGVIVTHWMSAKELLKGVEDNAEIH